MSKPVVEAICCCVALGVLALTGCAGRARAQGESYFEDLSAAEQAPESGPVASTPNPFKRPVSASCLKPFRQHFGTLELEPLSHFGKIAAVSLAIQGLRTYVRAIHERNPENVVALIVWRMEEFRVLENLSTAKGSARLAGLRVALNQSRDARASAIFAAKSSSVANVLAFVPPYRSYRTDETKFISDLELKLEQGFLSDRDNLASYERDMGEQSATATDANSETLLAAYDRVAVK